MATVDSNYERGLDSVEAGMHLVLQGLKLAYGIDPRDLNFKDTPARIRRAYAEMFAGMTNTKEQVDALLSTAFPCNNDSMVVQQNIRVFPMCPHHMLPCPLVVDIAYIPKKDGYVLGLSKLARLADVLGKRLVLQEQYTKDVSDSLMRIPGVQGAACVARGAHFCMTMRGVKQSDAETISSSLAGYFSTEAATRAEFFSLTRRG